MKRRTFQARCPCCGEGLVVDLHQRRVEPRDKTKRRQDDLIGDANEVLEKDEDRRQDRFEAAFDEETSGQKPSLDDLL